MPGIETLADVPMGYTLRSGISSHNRAGESFGGRRAPVQTHSGICDSTISDHGGMSPWEPAGQAKGGKGGANIKRESSGTPDEVSVLPLPPQRPAANIRVAEGPAHVSRPSLLDAKQNLNAGIGPLERGDVGQSDPEEVQPIDPLTPLTYPT